MPNAMTRDEAHILLRVLTEESSHLPEYVSINDLAEAVGRDPGVVEAMLIDLRTRGGHIPRPARRRRRFLGIRAQLMGLPVDHDPITREDKELWKIIRRVKAISPRNWTPLTDGAYRAGNVLIELVGGSKVILSVEDESISRDRGNGLIMLLNLYYNVHDSRFQRSMRKSADKAKVRIQSVRMRADEEVRVKELRRFRRKL